MAKQQKFTDDGVGPTESFVYVLYHDGGGMDSVELVIGARFVSDIFEQSSDHNV